MRRRITWRSAAAISMLGLAPAIGAAFAGPAGASTNDCLAAYGTQCGTFTESAASADGASGGLGWAVKGQSGAYNTPLIEYKNYSPGTDPSTDLTKVEHYGPVPGSPSASPGIWYSIVYTPNGKWTSMCVANPDNKGRGGTDLVLRSCNQQVWQAFMAVTPIPARVSSAPKAPATTTSSPLVLPPAPTPTSTPPWTASVLIPNRSTTTVHGAFALYSVANDRFVEGARPYMSAADTGSRPAPPPTALSATGRTHEPLDHNDNSWWWTNANGKP